MPSPGRPPQPPGRLTIALSDVSSVAVCPPLKPTCLWSRWRSSRSLAFGSARRTPRCARPRLPSRGRSFPSASSARVLPSLSLFFSASFARGGGAAFGRRNPPPGRPRCEHPTDRWPPRGGPRCSRSSSASLAAGWWGRVRVAFSRPGWRRRAKQTGGKKGNRPQQEGNRPQQGPPWPRTNAAIRGGDSSDGTFLRSTRRQPGGGAAVPAPPPPRRGPAHTTPRRAIAPSSIRQGPDRGRSIQGPTANPERPDAAHHAGRAAVWKMGRPDATINAARRRVCQAVVAGNPHRPQDRLLERVGIIHTA